jgi:predicted AlkP superfamily pyrophosphatase or phosphodiesterase
MSKLKRFFSLALVVTQVFLISLPVVPAASASAYDGKPKLVIILVIDQFREDYLERYRDDLKGRGFKLFLDHGAYFPDCYYNYANTKTAPGHSTIGTGAYTDGHGINSNEWWDLARNKDHAVSSVEDERYHLVGLVNASGTTTGSSPRNLRASTVGDELRMATNGHSLVYGVSLKDRASILPSGAAANGAFWIDAKSGSFITSSFYMNELPKWAVAFNGSDRAEEAMQEAGVTKQGDFYESVGKTPAANSYELDFAKALITNEQLGKHATTDMVTISISAPDISGHSFGPDSPEQRVMVDSLDTQLDSFFTWLEKNVDGGLGNVWIALSADHGVAPVPAQAATLGMPAAEIDMGKLTANLNEAMNAKFSPGEKVVYILPKQGLPYLSLNIPSFQVAGINELEAEQAVQNAVEPAFEAISPAPTSVLTPVPYKETATAPDAVAPAKASKTKSRPTRATTAKTTAKATAAPVEPAGPPVAPPTRYAPKPFPMHVFTRLELAAGQLPPSEFGTLMAHSYSPNGGWYVMVIPEAYQMEHYGNGGGTNHYTPYSYDRHVPLAFFGAPFNPGIYRGRVEPVDLAATLASLLGINQPSAAVGHVLTQAVRPTPVAPLPRAGRHAHVARATPDAAPTTEAPAVESPEPKP